MAGIVALIISLTAIIICLYQRAWMNELDVKLADMDSEIKKIKTSN